MLTSKKRFPRWIYTIYKRGNENNNFLKFTTPSVSQYLSILENNFVSLYLSLSSFNATLIIDLSIIPLPIYCRERNNRMK